MKVSIAASLCVAMLALSGCNRAGTTYISSQPSVTPFINVSATGISAREPDRAIVMAGTISEGKTAREAMIGNATIMTAVFDELEKSGIARKNISTSQLSLQPRYNYDNRRNNGSRPAPRIDGYEARNTVSVTSDDIEAVGVMLDALVRAGVNNINNISFSVKDPKAAKDEARTQAIQDARSKAEDMAQAAGVKLGKLVSMNEAGGSFPQRGQVQLSRAAVLDSGSTPISAGEQTLSVTVNMVYEIID